MGVHPDPGGQAVLVALAAIAMGVQSAVVLRLHAGPTTTYVTGTLTSFTTGMIRWLRWGGPEPCPVPTRSGEKERPWMYGVAWGVYVAGAFVTTLVCLQSREAALLLPIVVLGVVVLVAHVLSVSVPLQLAARNATGGLRVG
jgi:uncharacterized membrane protein YoaK (UPF0700 family)